MKKIIIILFIFSLLFFVGCEIKQVLPSDDLVDEDSEEIVLPDEIKNINKDDLVAMSGFHSMISSFIFYSTNKSLLEYLLDLGTSIKYTELLTDENRDPVAVHQDKNVSIQLTNDRILRLTLTTESNVYLHYLEKENDEFVTKYEYKAYKPEQYSALTAFCQMGMPQNHWWCETPACTKYYTGDYPIEDNKQESIVKKFIDEKSPLRDYFENGTKFSGFIRKSYGKYNGCYAVMVDGCGLVYLDCEEDVIIDGVSFHYSDGNQIYLIGGGVYSLQNALEREIITHDDLVKISEKQNENYNDNQIVDPNIDDYLELKNSLLNMTVNELYDFSSLYKGLVHCNYCFISYDKDTNIVIRMSKDCSKIENVSMYPVKSFNKDVISKIQYGMRIEEVVEMIGNPIGSFTSGINSLRFLIDDDTMINVQLVDDLIVSYVTVIQNNWVRCVDNNCDPDNISNASKAELIKLDMTFNEVVEILGKPIAALGSGAIWYEWKLDNDNNLRIHFGTNGMQDNSWYVLKIIKEKGSES